MAAKANRSRQRSRLAPDATVEDGAQPGQPQQLRRPAPGGRAPTGQSIPAACAVTGDVDRRPPWPDQDARTVRTADDDAAPRAFAPNHATTGSQAAAPSQTPRARIPGPDHEPLGNVTIRS